MKTIPVWQGVRMRKAVAAAEDDMPPRGVILPAAWEDSAAVALAGLAPGAGPVSLPAAAQAWIGPLAARAAEAGMEADFGTRLHRLILARRGAPSTGVWRGEPEPVPGFVLNLAAFHDADAGFDVDGLGAAAALAGLALRLVAGDGAAIAVGFAGLDDLLAELGVAYESRAGRDAAACLAALLRARVALALASGQLDLLAEPAGWPAPPAASVIPGLAEAAAAARARIVEAPGALPRLTGIGPAGPVEALLGVETGGVAPAFAPVRDGRLTRAAQARLAGQGTSPEAALAEALMGGEPLTQAGIEAHAAMHEAVARYIEAMPPHPVALPAAAAPLERGVARRRALPARQTGLSQKVSVGGHRVFLRTGEYPDGSLGEIAVTLPREGAAARGLMEGLAAAVSLGLQHGVPVDAFIDLFALTRFGPAGAVEGDPAAAHASSVLDYLARTLSVNYLGRSLPEPEVDVVAAPSVPMLPLDLPRERARRGLRLVA